jgi:hypothetical protein
MDALGHPIQCAHVDLASSFQVRRIRYRSVASYYLPRRGYTDATGYLNGPATNEPMFACFEYLPVILAVGLWSIIPPSRFIEDKLPGSEARARRNELEVEPKLEAVRSDETEVSSRV